MIEPTYTLQDFMMHLYSLITSVFWGMAGEVAYLWLEIAIAVFALVAFCWVVSR